MSKDYISVSSGNNEIVNLPESKDDHFYVGSSVTLSKNSKIKSFHIHIEDHVNIGKHVEIECEELFLGKDVFIGDHNKIRGKRISIGKHSNILENNHITVAEEFQLGDCSTFGRGCQVVCRKLQIGRFYYGGNEIDFGGGGTLNPNSIFIMGDYGFLGNRCIVNTSDRITIGDDVGIGAEVMLWTHGAYLSILDGFPADFAPLQIGSHVWIPARSVILPGVTIGSNVVISIGSVVNRDIPTGVMAGGIPAKVIREHYYPKALSPEKKDILLRQVLHDYIPLLEYKELLPQVVEESDQLIHINVKNSHQLLYAPKGESLKCKLEPNRKPLIITFHPHETYPLNSTLFNLSTFEITGEMDDVAEDLRDYLRRRGIKFYTDQKFTSIIPPPFKNHLKK
ncbi:hypothetical protein L1765_04860 [Microaerobacter geothermalis]|uniref:hypothetical protein n=1 Tax=Microaerobacter geothermalis TaxID=674972 RepID=UPI001F2FF66E|nr:hypothetical protein [Microaerobacter geothermalis]MCF6093326.1 hypothetical protein [Microaerobacter geothermalis]